MSNEVWKTGALSWSAINAGTASIANTDVIADGIIIYVEGIVNTSQKNVNYKVGIGGTTQFKDLPYKQPVYIEISANTNVSTYNFDVDGNCLIFHNTSATARTITLDGSTNFSLPAYGTAIWRYNTAWWNEDSSETGSFTPSLEFGGASVGITFSTQDGYYYRSGKSVFMSIDIRLTSKGSSTGVAKITNLPFVNSLIISSFSIGRTNIISTGQRFVRLAGGASELNITTTTDAGVDSNIEDTAFSNTSIFIISGTYLID